MTAISFEKQIADAAGTELTTTLLTALQAEADYGVGFTFTTSFSAMYIYDLSIADGLVITFVPNNFATERSSWGGYETSYAIEMMIQKKLANDGSTVEVDEVDQLLGFVRRVCRHLLGSRHFVSNTVCCEQCTGSDNNFPQMLNEFGLFQVPVLTTWKITE